MSAEYELTRDKDGFLKCKDCSRCFFKEIMFENHLTKEHKKERETQIKCILIKLTRATKN